MRHGGVAEAPNFLDLGRTAFARHHESGNFRSPCPQRVFPEMLLVRSRVHHDARAVDDELGGNLRSDLVGEEVWSGSPRGDDAGIGDVHPALGRGRMLDELCQVQKPSSFTCKAAQSKQAGPEGTAGLSGPAFVLAPHAFALTYMIM